MAALLVAHYDAAMDLRALLRGRLEATLARRNFRRIGDGEEIVDARLLYDWQRNALTPQHESPIPIEADEYLRPDNPRLEELRQRYSSAETTDNLRGFRGDLRGSNLNPIGYALATYYIQSIDRLGLLNALAEDGLFGNVTFEIAGHVVSRDLLDSILEIYFLEKHLRLTHRKDAVILDIGAGYGRLAHRMVAVFPNLGAYLCTDATAASTFVSEFYLRFRGVDSRATVIPLDEIETTVRNRRIDIAVNIQSFSGCSLEAIEWWITLLARNTVRYLMIETKDELQSFDRQDFREALERAGYRLLAREPKYGDPIVQQYALDPTHHYLFGLRQ